MKSDLQGQKAVQNYARTPVLSREPPPLRGTTPEGGTHQSGSIGGSGSLGKVSHLSLPGASRCHFLDMSLPSSQLTSPSLELNSADTARNTHTSSGQEVSNVTCVCPG